MLWWMDWCAIGVAALVLALLLTLIWTHYRNDRPFPPGCCKRCGYKLADGAHQCPRCSRVCHPCAQCGYDVTGLTEPRCPECGQSFEPRNGA